MLFPKVRPRKKQKALDEKRLKEIIERELGSRGYMSREDLKSYLDEIKKDERKKRVWDSMPLRKKVRVLRHMIVKKGERYGKK